MKRSSISTIEKRLGAPPARSIPPLEDRVQPSRREWTKAALVAGAALVSYGCPRDPYVGTTNILRLTVRSGTPGSFCKVDEPHGIKVLKALRHIILTHDNASTATSVWVSLVPQFGAVVEDVFEVLPAGSPFEIQRGKSEVLTIAPILGIKPAGDFKRRSNETKAKDYSKRFVLAVRLTNSMTAPALGHCTGQPDHDSIHIEC